MAAAGAAEVFADEQAARTAAGGEGVERDDPEAMPFLKSQDWKLGPGTEPVGRHVLVESQVVPGRITAAAGAEALISNPDAGRVLPPTGGSVPRAGERVAAGRVGAPVEPPLTGLSIPRSAARHHTT